MELKHQMNSDIQSANWEKHSDRFYTYEPCGITIPRSLGLWRMPHYWGGKVDSGDVTPELYTAFYDIFRSYKGDEIIAIGPELLNLEEDLGQLRVFVDGVEIKYRQRLLGLDRIRRADPIKFNFVTIQLGPEQAAQSQLEVLFKWDLFEKRVLVGKHPLGELKEHELTITTMQKDSPPIWITDWLNYHHKVHGVSRVVLYDNASADFQAIKNLFMNIDAVVEVILVNWRYPFGFIRTRYSQQGSLNHCYHWIGHKTKYFLNFDLDEYLINKTPQRLSSYLQRRFDGTSRMASIEIRECKVPNVKKASDSSEIPRLGQYDYREKSIGAHSPKNIFRYGRVDYISHHIIVPRWPVRFRWILNFLHSKSRTRYLKLPLSGFFFTALAADNELYFNHYQGLNSGWKIPERTHIQEYDPIQHERDDFMIRTLARVNLREKRDP